MEIIQSKQTLNTLIKEILWDETNEETKTFHFCYGLGQPTFKITIEKIDRDVFIDGKGNRWVKEKR